MIPNLLSLQISFPKTAAALTVVLVIACLDLVTRAKHKQTRYTLGVVLGTTLSIGMIHAVTSLLAPEVPKQGTGVALGVFMLVVCWRMLFGEWEAQTKATVLGTFVFWIAFHMLFQEEADARFARIIAILVALIPAAGWSLMFLPYHRERLGVVFTMLFAGMLSTVPILFYDALVRHGVQMHFFLFRVVPEGFSSSAQMFVSGNWPGIAPLQSSLITMFLSFVFVGVIEEGSKLWVLKRAGRSFCTSIDDVMQMAVLTAIGFAFAENIVNSGYFVAFVREYLLNPETRNFLSFFGNVAGRSVLTAMVHIVSTGLMGYYLGLALFAGPLLREKQSHGTRYRLMEKLHDILGVPRRDLYARTKIAIGFTLAVFLHALSNFLVSLPDALPGNPHTVGDLLHSGPGSPFHYIALLLPPTLLYVVGGFLLLTALFQRKENMREMGHILEADEIVMQ